MYYMWIVPFIYMHSWIVVIVGVLRFSWCFFVDSSAGRATLVHSLSLSSYLCLFHFFHIVDRIEFACSKCVMGPHLSRYISKKIKICRTNICMLVAMYLYVNMM